MLTAKERFWVASPLALGSQAAEARDRHQRIVRRGGYVQHVLVGGVRHNGVAEGRRLAGRGGRALVDVAEGQRAARVDRAGRSRRPRR